MTPDRRRVWGEARMYVAGERLGPGERQAFRQRLAAGEDPVELAREMEALAFPDPERRGATTSGRT